VADRLVAVAGALEQMRPHCIEPMGAREMRIAGEAVQGLQTGGRTVDHRERNRVTETGHRAVLESKQQRV
jgi:hypothetical protein